MAQQTFRPTLCAFLYPPKCVPRIRYLSTSAVRPASKLRMQGNYREPNLKSFGVMKNLGAGMQLPTDIGLAPGLFIMPTGPRKPSIFTSPRRRLKLEWYRLKMRAQDLISFWTGYKRAKGSKPFPKRARRTLVPTAKALHRQMYTAFAEGDRATLQKICTDGLSDSFIARVASRSPGEHFRWNLSKYLGFPRVVADRSVILPVKDSALRQVAVRIRSKQSLAKIIPATKGQPETVVEGTDKEKNVDEYVVIQRRIIKGKEDQWMVWGTTQETRVDEVLGTQETKAANKEAEAV